ncbi:MAG: pitrilysin family protein, partial [Gammaproteobacteria bacterium]
MAISPRKPLFLLLALVLLGPVRAEANPDIQHWITTHGLKVYFVHAPQVPMLDIRLVFHAGSAYDGKHPGLAQLTSNLVGSGADGMDADAIAARFDAVGAQFDTGALRDMAWVSLRSLNAPEYLDPSLSTLINLLAKPTFPQADYTRTLKQMQVGLQAQEQDPGAIADKAMMHALYGDHPYASPPEGTMQSLKRIRRSDVADYFRRYYVARNGVLALVGAVDRAQAEKIAARIGAALAEGKPAPALPPVPPLGKAQTIRIPYPSAQAHILIGQPGIRRGAP